MAARPYQFAALTETPVSIESVTGISGALEIQTLDVHNTNATGCYVKIYAGSEAPEAGDVPLAAYWCAQGRTPIAVFCSGARFWLAAATEFGAGLSAPVAPVNVTATISRGGA